MKIIASIEDPFVIGKILSQLEARCCSQGPENRRPGALRLRQAFARGTSRPKDAAQGGGGYVTARRSHRFRAIWDTVRKVPLVLPSSGWGTPAPICCAGVAVGQTKFRAFSRNFRAVLPAQYVGTTTLASYENIR